MPYSMSYASLVGDKNTAGSIARWVNYSKLDADQILQEAQSLLYSMLRIREMRAHFNFDLAQGADRVALPAGFLDPIGKISMLGTGAKIEQRYPNFIQRRRTYTETTGSLGANPFTTANGSNLVTVNLANHGLSQGSTFFTTGAAAFNGVTIVGIFDVVAIADTNDFVIDITPLGVTPSASGAGGGSAATYIADNLVQGTPLYWGVWDETIFFDVAFAAQTNCNLQYFKSLPILSTANPTNFLTNRYPHLLRKACTAQAWDFMRNSDEYQKDVAALAALVEQVNAESDLLYRGAAFETYLHDE
ncbi:MAG: hypothetical protein JO328_21365 [Hyphomicrobiales bacterium]|nr:hypothetical protein [Hyphomicrobiales bacterium]MBV9429116.1 hypothetical protein [Bradyrhizobiaceae bacterium]